MIMLFFHINEVDNYVMKISFPAIKSERPKAYVVDTPGSNEVGEVQLQQIADIALQTTSAYIYVMTYSDIKNREDYRALKSIYERDQGMLAVIHWYSTSVVPVSIVILVFVLVPRIVLVQYHF